MDEETVVDALLQALGLVAGGHQGAGLSGCVGITFLNAGVLVVFYAIRLDFVDDGTPLAFGVNGTQRLDVGGGAGAEVSLILQFGQSVDRVGRFGDDVLVQSQNGLVVSVEFVNDFVGRVLGVLQAPVLGRVFGTFRDLRLVFRFVFRLVIRRRLVIATHYGRNT